VPIVSIVVPIDAPIRHGIQPNGPPGDFANRDRNISEQDDDTRNDATRIGMFFTCIPIFRTASVDRVLRAFVDIAISRDGWWTDGYVLRGGEEVSRGHRRRLEEGGRGRREGERRRVLASAFER
jgi:hypothetical protein